MAVRAPAGYTGYVNTKYLLPRQQVLCTPPDDALNDQHFALDQKELVISDSFSYIALDPAVYAGALWTSIIKYYCTFPDMCGDTATLNGQFSLNIVAGGTWDFAIYNLTIPARYTFTPGGAWGPAWCGTSGNPGWTNMVLASDGTENELVVQARCPTGVGAGAYLGGVGVYIGQ